MTKKIFLSFTFFLSLLLELVCYLSKYPDLTNWYINSFVSYTIRILLIIIGIILLIIMIFNKKTISKIIYIISLVSSIISLILIILVITFTNIIIYTHINGTSMEDTLNDGDLVTIKVTKNIKENDIIVFEVNPDDNKVDTTSYYIKRVIAKENDKVVINDGKLYINDTYIRYLDSKDNFDGKFTYYVNKTKYETNVIPSGYLFVLGDNRNLSRNNDSLIIGLIKIDNITGIVKNN